MPKISFPKEFIENISSILPYHLSMASFIESCEQPLRRSIRLNPLKQSDISKLQPTLCPLEPIPWCENGFWLTQEPEFSLGNHVTHLSGQFYIQEASSMLPPKALEYAAKRAGVELNLVMDMAAAPGSKTTQLAAMMQNQGGLVANEYSSSRLKVLAANTLRCGVTNTALTHFDASVLGATLPNTFDAILLDAPCSGEGTIRKDLNAFANWDMASVHEIASLQKRLIESAFHALKPGGIMVYSTCTLNQYENQGVCQHLLELFKDSVEAISLAELFEGAQDTVTPEGYLHVWPQVFDSEGFFIAAFKKLETSSPEAEQARKPGKFPYQRVNAKSKAELATYLASISVELPEHLELYQRNTNFWLFPKILEPLFGQVRFDRIGIKLAEQFKQNYRLAHDFAIACPQSFKQNRIELSGEQAQAFLQGKDLRDVDGLPNKGECLILFEEMPLGLGKALSGRLKNSLPRELVRDQPVIKTT